MSSDSTLLFPKSVFLVNMSSACVAGFFMNLLLLYLIIKKTPKEMKSYSRIMRVHCLSDIIYDFIQCFSGVHAHPIKGKIYMMLQGFYTNMSVTWTRYIIDLYFWSLFFSIALLPIDYIYRYLAVCKNRNLTNRQLFLMVFAAYFITWLHAFPNSFLSLEIGPSPDSLEFTRELQTFPDWTNNVPSYAVTVLGSKKALFNFTFVLLLNSFSYGIITWVYFKINAKLQQNAHTVNNAKTIEIQKAVSRILALQALLPLFVIGLPVVITVIFAISRYDLPHFGAYSSMVYIWLSAAKPTATIFIIPRYRVYIRQKLRSFLLSRASNTVTIETIKTTESRVANSVLGPQSRHYH